MGWQAKESRLITVSKGTWDHISHFAGKGVASVCLRVRLQTPIFEFGWNEL